MQKRLTVSGMGRPRTYRERRITTTVRLTETLKNRLDQVAAERDISFNLIVERACIDWLDNVPSVEESLQVRPPGAAVRSMAERRLGGG